MVVTGPRPSPEKSGPSFSTSGIPGRTYGSITPPATLTASGTSSPARASRTDFATDTPAFSWASSVDAPRRGVTTTFGSPTSPHPPPGSLTNTPTAPPALSWAWAVGAPGWGVTTTFGSRSSGDPVGGSLTNTSRPAPEIVLLARAVYRASSSMRPPRATLTMNAVGFMSANWAVEIMPVVSGVFGM